MSEKRTIRVGDVMGSKLYTIDRLATVAEAMALMKQYEVSSLAVDRRDDDDEFGLLVVADIAREVIAQNRAPERVNVYEIMSKPVLTLPSAMLARYAVRLLVRFELSRAVVVDYERHPLGMVTLRDLVLSHVAE
ncbi:MAG: CBS domain-containing protein [Gemmatimonadetes bacterium]|nr:CBS domain-containing protein [Gemmatimonadota bacterium]MDE2810444.1 CBS domain-containing protein [Gemmatimonadota bacterium]MXW80891.1 CBS domain-containing protein [Gemmatimonadota bacterium]MXX38699.1 CBS domain-containing protein [Gemmatimonadota bacterium]MYA24125.1 CBS domain-containing protein [Gemmatimonadota bacterium]